MYSDAPFRRGPRHAVTMPSGRIVINPTPSDYGEELWLEEFTRNGLCMLCGNSGIIDTIGRVRGPVGQICGGRNHCICPNGRRMKQLGHEL